MKIRLLIISCLLSLSLSATTLYKVVGKDGSVTYTDTPQAGAQPVELGKVNVVDSPAPKKPLAKASKLTGKRYPDYELTMTSPSDGESIRSNQGQLSVSATLSPQGNGTFQLFLDDVLYDTNASPVFRLENVDRGEHSLQIKFLHHSGKILASTQKHVVYLHRTSVLINAN